MGPYPTIEPLPVSYYVERFVSALKTAQPDELGALNISLANGLLDSWGISPDALSPLVGEFWNDTKTTGVNTAKENLIRKIEGRWKTT